MNTVSDNVKDSSEQNTDSEDPEQNNSISLEDCSDTETTPSEPETFDELIPSKTLLNAIKKLGFSEPTTVQRRTIPPALDGKDLIVQAKTGSGKTFAFALPLLAKMEAAGLTQKAKHTYSLVLTPTRELALQIVEVVESLIPDVEPACLIGGADIKKQIAALKKDKRFVVGTPGRVLDLLKQKELRLNRVGYFVLDEADEMLSMGFLEDVRAILSRLPEKRQGLFVSATITPRVDMIANSFLKKAIQIHGDNEDDQQPLIEHLYAEVKGDVLAKPDALCDIIETYRPDSAIVFCNTRSDTQMVEALLRRRGFDARRINSDLTQSQRDKIMKKIRAKDLRILIATDIAARGLDIEQISLIVNYSIHEQPEIYVHRTGRTGRAGRSGRAISLVGPRDFGAFHFLNKVLEVEFEKMELPKDREVCTARVAHLYQILRETKMDVNKRDLIIARKMISELNGETPTAKEFEYTVAKLCRSLLEKHMRQDTKSLDEEFESADASSQSQERDRDRSRGRDRDRDRGRGRDRGERSSRDRGGDRSDDRRRDSKPKRDDNRRDADRRDGRSDRSDRDSRSYDRDKRESNREEQPQEVRLYIGQGKENGMTDDLFKEIATGIADLKEGQIKRSVFRQRHGFVDLMEPHASQLVSALNGIEYNGITLPVERAALLNQNKPNRGGGRGNQRNDRRGGGDRRGGDRRGNDRRGGGNRSHNRRD